MYFRKSHVCAKKLDVQETNVSTPTVSTESEKFRCDDGLRMDWTYSRPLGCGEQSVTPQATLKDLLDQLRPRKLVHSRKPVHQLKRESERLSNCQMWITYPQTHSLLKASLSCTFLRTTKLSSR